MAQKHRADANKRSPSEYKARLHKNSKPGEWRGAYVPLRAVNAAKLIREIGGRAQ